MICGDLAAIGELEALADLVDGGELGGGPDLDRLAAVDRGGDSAAAIGEFGTSPAGPNVERAIAK